VKWGVRIGEVVAIVLIAGALSLGFLGGNPNAQVPSYPALTLVNHYTGLSWTVYSSYRGVADGSPFIFLQGFGSNPISYVNMTDQGGDMLSILQVKFPSQQSALNYLESTSSSSPSLVNGVWVSTYSLGQVEIVYLVSGDNYVQISYVGSSGALPSLSSMVTLATQLVQ